MAFLAHLIPSRLTLAKLAFFIVLNLVTRTVTSGGSLLYWPTRITASIYFDRWENRQRLSKGIPEQTGWWAWIKTHVIVPWLGSYGANAVSWVFAFLLFSYSRTYSLADACYTFLDFGGVLDLSDSMVISKGEICAIKHNVSRSDIAISSSAFKYLYRTANQYVKDLQTECMFIVGAHSTINDEAICARNYQADATRQFIDSFERCSRFTGTWDPDATAKWHTMAEQALAQMKNMEMSAGTQATEQNPQAVTEVVAFPAGPQ